jgi:hypothetical protein
MESLLNTDSHYKTVTLGLQIYRTSWVEQPTTAYKGEQMKIYTLLGVLLLIFVACKHFESRHSTSTGTGALCKPQCSDEQINELAEPIF